MADSESKINVGTYFKTGTKFIIPSYQRGYKWGMTDPDQVKSSVEYFCDCLSSAYLRNDREYFIEAVTVVNENGSTILVDGQQRTATLFLLFVALKEFEFLSGVDLSYAVRKDSHAFLKNLINDHHENIPDEDIQDIYYFNMALNTINKSISEIKIIQETKILNEPDYQYDKSFSEFIKENVFLLLNCILKDKAVNTFIALNGLKAIMKDEELIKSELLIKSSRVEQKEVTELNDDKEKLGIEWKINEDRGRLARNWDKWLYWWNQPDVRDYFAIKNHPLYYLLRTYWKINKKEKNGDFRFDDFKNEFIVDSKSAKNHVEGLRKLQKTFEDLYSKDDYSYNFLGIIMKTSEYKEEALLYFLDNKIERTTTLEEYAKWSLVDSTHNEIINNTKEKIPDSNNEILSKKRKAEEAINLINEKYVYWDEQDKDVGDRQKYAYSFLMLLNLLEDHKLQRRFDFTIWKNRSLEHIYPKSKQDDLDFTKEEYEEGSIHCIGNLVLLYGDNNKAFGAKKVEEKKKIYFNTGNILKFQSRNLLHSISVFAHADWREKEIIENKRNIIKVLTEYYGRKN